LHQSFLVIFLMTRRKHTQNNLHFALLISLCLALFLLGVNAQSKYENRRISDIQITFEGADKEISAAEQFRLILKPIIGDKFSTVKNREALQTLHDSKKIILAKIEVVEKEQDSLILRFVIKRKTNATSVKINFGQFTGEPVTEAELLLKLNILNAGSFVTDQLLKNNADSIQTYLRERGYYNGEVDFAQQTLGNDTRVAVVFNVKPNTQSRIDSFKIDIEGFDEKTLKKPLKLKKGSYFSDKTLDEDVVKIRTLTSSLPFNASSSGIQ
jgi:outer membrane protein assembly factor BamA